MHPTPSRNNSIDNVRLLAIFGIVVMHSFPFFFAGGEATKNLAITLNQITRFGVPCFFVISGYLFALRSNATGVGSQLRKSAPRLLLLYFFWCIFYILPYDVALIDARDPQGHITFAKIHMAMWLKSPENFLLAGSKTHLWFLPALLCAMLVCAPFIAARKYTPMLALTAMLFVSGLLAGPYQDKLVHLSLPIGVRNGPIFSSVFFAIGVVIARIGDTRYFARLGIALTIIGAIGQLAELFALLRTGYAPPLLVYPDYLVSTLALGTGPALLAISGKVASNNKPWLWGLGRYTLGIYALHLFVMDFFIPITGALVFDWRWQLVCPLIYFALTAALVALLARVRRLRPLIS